MSKLKKWLYFWLVPLIHLSTTFLLMIFVYLFFENTTYVCITCLVCMLCPVWDMWQFKRCNKKEQGS